MKIVQAIQSVKVLDLMALLVHPINVYNAVQTLNVLLRQNLNVFLIIVKHVLQMEIVPI